MCVALKFLKISPRRELFGSSDCEMKEFEQKVQDSDRGQDENGLSSR